MGGYCPKSLANQNGSEEPSKTHPPFSTAQLLRNFMPGTMIIIYGGNIFLFSHPLYKLFEKLWDIKVGEYHFLLSMVKSIGSIGDGGILRISVMFGLHLIL